MSDIELGGRDINGRLSLLSCFPSSERGRLVNFVNLHSLCREELDLTWPVCTIIINKQQVIIMRSHRMGNLWLFLMWRAVSKINMIYKYLLDSLILLFPRCPEDNTWNIYFWLHMRCSGWLPIYSQCSVVSCYHGLLIFGANLPLPLLNKIITTITHIQQYNRLLLHIFLEACLL